MKQSPVVRSATTVTPAALEEAVSPTKQFLLDRDGDVVDARIACLARTFAA